MFTTLMVAPVSAKSLPALVNFESLKDIVTWDGASLSDIADSPSAVANPSSPAEAPAVSAIPAGPTMKALADEAQLSPTATEVLTWAQQKKIPIVFAPLPRSQMAMYDQNDGTLLINADYSGAHSIYFIPVVVHELTHAQQYDRNDWYASDGEGTAAIKEAWTIGELKLLENSGQKLSSADKKALKNYKFLFDLYAYDEGMILRQLEEHYRKEIHLVPLNDMIDEYQRHMPDDDASCRQALVQLAHQQAARARKALEHIEKAVSEGSETAEPGSDHSQNDAFRAEIRRRMESIDQTEKNSKEVLNQTARPHEVLEEAIAQLQAQREGVNAVLRADVDWRSNHHTLISRQVHQLEHHMKVRKWILVAVGGGSIFIPMGGFGVPSVIAGMVIH